MPDSDEFVRLGGGVSLVGGLGDVQGEGVEYVHLDDPAFRQREAQVQTMAGRTLSLTVTRFAALLVSLVQPAIPGK